MSEGVIDFAGIWNETIRAHRSRRHLEPVDRAFWAKQAEANAAWTRQTPETLAALCSLLSSSDTLLDVGAGTGRFAVQLAPCVSHVTALDYSAEMLGRLEQKRSHLGITNVEAKLGHLMTAELAPHSTVLAAWSLYSSCDILSALGKLLSLATRQLIIIDDDSSGSPHRQLRQKLWEPRAEPMPKYLVLTGSLWQLGVRAEVRIIRETSRMTFASEGALLDEFCPVEADKTERARFLELLSPYLASCENGLEYSYPFEVALIRWEVGGMRVRLC